MIAAHPLRSVLPPPPRYPVAGYPGAPGGGQLIETNNTLTHPTGPEHQLVVGEGTFLLSRQTCPRTFALKS